MTRRSVLAAAGLAGILALSLTGCGVANTVTNLVEGKEDVFTIEVGDCFNDDTSATEEIQAVEMPECTEEHDNEAYLVYDVSETDFPEYDDAGLQTAAEEGCFAEFESFVGAPFDSTNLSFSFYYPGAQGWQEGDREILCFAYDLAGPISESLVGKGPDYPYEG
jgi:hypothetical protein